MNRQREGLAERVATEGSRTSHDVVSAPRKGTPNTGHGLLCHRRTVHLGTFLQGDWTFHTPAFGRVGGRIRDLKGDNVVIVRRVTNKQTE